MNIAGVAIKVRKGLEETMLIIETERLILRSWKSEDYIEFRKINADPEVMRYFPKVLDADESDQFAERIHADLKLNGYGLFAAEEKSSGSFIGFIGFKEANFEADFTPCVEIGWRLCKRAWGKGYATEGARACLANAFENFGLEAIYSFTATINRPSENVMKKIGMKKIGEFDHPRLEPTSPLLRHVLYRYEKKDYYREAIRNYSPINEQEASDKAMIEDLIKQYGDKILTRDVDIAHLTSSGLILNQSLDKILMVHHNIYNTWAWTGGHADADTDLLAVAIREGLEETGIDVLKPLTELPLSIDVLTVNGHYKRGKYVSAHLHLNLSYVLIASESSAHQIKPDENSGVMWVSVDALEQYSNEPIMIEVYRKIVNRARALRIEDLNK